MSKFPPTPRNTAVSRTSSSSLLQSNPPSFIRSNSREREIAENFSTCSASAEATSTAMTKSLEAVRAVTILKHLLWQLRRAQSLHPQQRIRTRQAWNYLCSVVRVVSRFCVFAPRQVRVVRNVDFIDRIVRYNLSNLLTRALTME